MKVDTAEGANGDSSGALRHRRRSGMNGVFAVRPPSMSLSGRNCSRPIHALEWSFQWRLKGLFRPHYVTWSEQRTIEGHAPEYLRNLVKIITETGLRIYKEFS